MDQRMFKFRWKQKYQLYLKTWMRKSESTRQYVFLKQSAASDPPETLKERGGCGSLMYNCHLIPLKGSPGDLNDNMRASMDSQKFPHSPLKCCHSKVCTDLCWFTGAAWCWLCWGRAGWNRYISAWLWEAISVAETQGYTDGSTNKATKNSHTWLCCKLGVSAAFARGKTGK